MCRVLAYLGEPLPVRNLLFDTDNGLVAQSYSPRMMNTFLNLAGFGMQAWDPNSLRPEDPFTYRTTTLPSFDRNLRFLSAKVAPACLAAHVRGVTYSDEAVVADTNLHRSASQAPVSSSRTTGTCGSSGPCATRSSSTCGRSSPSA
jgi:glutamine amidotransferase